MRAEDTVARIGGDEFALVMSNVRTQGDVAPLLERCLQAIRQPIALDGGATVGIGASIGAVFGTGGESGWSGGWRRSLSDLARAEACRRCEQACSRMLAAAKEGHDCKESASAALASSKG